MPKHLVNTGVMCVHSRVSSLGGSQGHVAHPLRRTCAGRSMLFARRPLRHGLLGEESLLTGMRRREGSRRSLLGFAFCAPLGSSGAHVGGASTGRTAKGPFENFPTPLRDDCFQGRPRTRSPRKGRARSRTGAGIVQHRSRTARWRRAARSFRGHSELNCSSRPSCSAGV